MLQRMNIPFVTVFAFFFLFYQHEVLRKLFLRTWKEIENN